MSRASAPPSAVNRGLGHKPGGAEARTLWSQLCRYWLPPIYYFLDLNDRTGRPNHGKVLSTVAFFLGCVGIVAAGTGVLREDSIKGHASELAWILAYSALVFSLPFGLSGFKVWASTKGGGTTEALARIGVADLQTSAEVAARRAQGGGDFEVTA